MTETPQRRVEFTEDQIPRDGIEETISGLVELYGGEVTASQANMRRFTLPLRRGVAAAGAIECTVSWPSPESAGSAETTVTLVCDRELDAPKAQRILLLVVGVIGALLFTMWPFFSHARELGTLAWVGGAVAIAVYFMTLRRTSGGIAYDFLQRLARAQRERETPA